MSLENQVIVIYAGTRGFADHVQIDQVRSWASALIRFMETSHPDIGRSIVENKQITPENEEILRQALTAFKSSWQ